MNKIIIGEQIVKSFGEGKERHKVLDRVSVEINEGEFVAVMGPSGSGKTTLMFALSGMDRIDSGKVAFDGVKLSDLGEKELSDIRRTKMGFVFQQPTMLKNLNLLDNIILPTVRDNRKNTTAISEKARKLMKRVGIGDFEKRDITQVSGGQLQRAGICRALMNEPKILFGDEPTGALNSKSADEIMNILSEINEDDGTAIMLVTHDAKVAARAERILFMKDGIIVNETKTSKFARKNLENRVEKINLKMRELGI
ncbi:ABC transporter ATP-binding protein [Paucisalibacillus globulus]|uniref:ABC transporter ATP-binding protein n=1 Tax=Paucisalibacillus globulus TaxID=351095 RepID=UPI00040D120A|nr:ABC transporter ATP-binding protein [Paucisalibacillus globulus]